MALLLRKVVKLCRALGGVFVAGLVPVLPAHYTPAAQVVNISLREPLPLALNW
ncbi:MAG: hypothetical protein V1696_02305 [Candidatus Jorgensenbacteria bacterium]